MTCSTLLIAFAFILSFSNFSSAIEETNFKENQGAKIDQNEFYQRQLEILKLLDNLNCNRTEDADLTEIALTFNPREHLDSYSNSSAVLEYLELLEQGNLESKEEPFTNNQQQLNQMIKLFDILFFIDTKTEEGWDLFYNTSAYASLRVNTAQFYWTINTLLTSKYRGVFRVPQMFYVFPQLFTPKSTLLDINGMPIPPLEETPEEAYENQLRYFRLDPSVNSFHAAWHIENTFWWKPEKYLIEKDRKGELFVYMHHQLMNRYRAERLSNNMNDWEALVLNQPIKEGYNPDVLNINFMEFPTRKPNSTIKDTKALKLSQLESWQNRISEGITNGYFMTPSGEQISLRDSNGTDVFGDTIESSQQSANNVYYGSLHNSLHRILAQITDPDGSLNQTQGVLAHPETAVQDPVFFRLHRYIDNFLQSQKYHLPPYTGKDLEFSGVDLNSVQLVQENKKQKPKFKVVWPFETVTTLNTYFEDFSYDISNCIRNCSKVNSGDEFMGKVRRLNHKPFEYVITAYSHKTSDINATVRIFISPINGFDGKPVGNEQLHWSMIQMDSFPVVLKPRQNIIRRSSKESSLTFPGDPPSLKDLIQETKSSLASSQQKDKPREKNRAENGTIKANRLCGYPNNLLLPKGTPEGMRFKMFAIITGPAGGEINQNYNEADYPTLTFCGVLGGSFPDDKPMGFPFDRKINFPYTLPWFVHGNYKFLDFVIKHKS